VVQTTAVLNTGIVEMNSNVVAVISAQIERRLHAQGGTVLGPADGAPRKAASGFAGVSEAVRAACELSPVAVCLSHDGVIVFANTALARLFGLASSQHLQGRSLGSLFGPKSAQALKEHAVLAFAFGGRASTTLVVADEVPLLGAGVQRHISLVTAALPQASQGLLHHVLTDITTTAQAQLALERSKFELRQLSASQVEAREAERRHIAREMHDELGQRLTALKMEMASLGRLSAKSKNQRVQALLEMVDDTVASVRRIACDLRPLMLDDLGLNAAVEWLVRESAKRSGLNITSNLDEVTLPAHQEATVGIAIYRITQEALTNVARHAQATQVQLELKQLGGQLRLRVSDNGKGFCNPPKRPDHSHGLVGIRERVFSLGGEFEIANGPQGGAQLTVCIPLEAAHRVPCNATPVQSHNVRVPLHQRDLHLFSVRSTSNQ
jgi:two-component system, NarL family, sensor histidine kinase UhpB